MAPRPRHFEKAPRHATPCASRSNESRVSGRSCGSLQAFFLASFMKLLNSSLNLAYPIPTSTSTHQTKDHTTWDGRGL